MDFLDSIFSFIPLLMIILFVTRIIKANKKKRPKSQDTTPPDKTKKGESRLESLLDGGLVRIQQQFDKAADGVLQMDKEPKSQQTEPPSQPQFEPPSLRMPERPPEPESIGALKTAKAAELKRQAAAAAAPPASGRPLSRLQKLPELKKAVVWAEILGKPKGLD